MSKRVSNSRRNKQRIAPGRSTRIRLGFHRQRRLTNVERALEKHRSDTALGKSMGREEQESFMALKAALMKLMPKRMEHRGIR